MAKDFAHFALKIAVDTSTHSTKAFTTEATKPTRLFLNQSAYFSLLNQSEARSTVIRRSL